MNRTTATPTPLAAALATQFDQALQAAKSARRAALHNAAAFAAHLIRQAEPTVAVLIVDTDTGQLCGYRAADRTPLWWFSLDQHIADQIESRLADVLALGTDKDELTDAGWTNHDEEGTSELRLPAQVATNGLLDRMIHRLSTHAILMTTRAAVELYGAHGDPHDQLSSTQVEQLEALAALYADYEGSLDGPLYLLGELGVIGVIRSGVELFASLHDPGKTLTDAQTDWLNTLTGLLDEEDSASGTGA
ncbi:hypothetical protein [Kitasatospora sp. MBT66]|uniref:hypothetical protein n=1 Tax=Kitasatospora sp. MBT66 TaxID=1444769 RepID=UPI0005BE2F06|nr:hypothetical protein [Kitasatospora sp. MBT66]